LGEAAYSCGRALSLPAVNPTLLKIFH